MLKKDVIKYYKTQNGVAEALKKAGYDISQPAICQWDELIPELQARRLHEITRGKLKFVAATYK